MEKSNLKKTREMCVAHMQETLATIESGSTTTTPRWLLTLLITPLFIWEVGKTALHMAWSVTKQILACFLQIFMAPFVGAYIFFDIVVIMAWYFRLIINKMSGEK